MWKRSERRKLTELAELLSFFLPLLSSPPSSPLLQVKWRNLHFVMWDIGGQESLRQAWSTYYTGTHFLLLVVDSTDRERLSIAKEELYKMLGHEVRG